MTQRIKISGTRRLWGVTLTELLVVIAIMVILMAIMGAALGTFAHTSRVDAGAETLANAFREARWLAMSRNVPVTPVIMRDVDGRYSVSYAARMLNFRGELKRSDTPPRKWPLVADGENPWSMYRESLDAAELEQGAFVLLAGAPAINLDEALADKDLPYYEIVYMNVEPPDKIEDRTDSTKFKYNLLMRGVHNTRWGEFSAASVLAATQSDGAGGLHSFQGIDGYVFLDATGEIKNADSMTKEEMQRMTLSSAEFLLPEFVQIDQVPSLIDVANEEDLDKRRVGATITYEAAYFKEDSSAVAGAGFTYPPPWAFPVFFPVFMPDGSVTYWADQDDLLQTDLGGTRLQMHQTQSYTVRLQDTVTQEARYITITLGGTSGFDALTGGSTGGSAGNVFVSASPPKGTALDYSQAYPDPNDPDTKDKWTASTSSTAASASSTSSTASNSNSTTTAASSSSSTSASSSSSASSNSTASTGTASAASTAASSAASSNSTAAASSSSTSSSTSSTSAASSAATSAATASAASSSSNSTASTGTASTSSTSASSSSTSASSSSSTSASSNSTASSSTSNSTSASTANSAATAAAAAAASSGTGDSSGGGTSSGGDSSGVTGGI